MQHQKDTKKNMQNSYGHSSNTSNKSLATKSIFEFVNKKTEKLVTALYMVTDVMDEGDALKAKIRILGVELLSDMYKIESLSPIDKQIHLTRSLAHVYELLSFVDIACTIGFISEMNGSILKRELLVLVDELNSAQAESTRFSFSLDNDMFHVPESAVEHNRTISRGPHSIKDTLNNKRTINMSFTKSPINMSLKNNYHPALSNPIDKKERATKILALIKDTKDPSGVSIKDISSSFTNCSEKTIQRELNTLVLKGQIKKKGAKRWSRYSVIIN